ncbi:hypothetical protein ABW21_db0207237 [Orbilia brochopaga]|nr:hypothetical protein ABW21_db0207237 [Drechslerella brochopaga]
MQQLQHVSTFSLSLLLLSVLQPPIISAQDPRPCYFPGGQRANGYVACDDTTTGHSACCQNKNQTACFATGLCYLQNGFYERGACTDQSWQSDACPGPCRDFRNSGQDLLACDDSSDSFCCATGSKPSCCSDTKNYFPFNVGDIAFINGQPVARTRSASGNVTAPAASATPVTVDKAPTGLVVGMAVGIAIPSIIAVAFAAMYFRERRRRRRKRVAPQKLVEEDTHYDGYLAQDASESQGFITQAWPNGASGGNVNAVVPPKDPPSENWELPYQEATRQQQVAAQEPGMPVGELAGEGDRVAGLSELGVPETRRYP